MLIVDIVTDCKEIENCAELLPACLYFDSCITSSLNRFTITTHAWVYCVALCGSKSVYSS